MADITIIPANVARGDGSNTQDGVAAVAIAAGDVVRRNSSGNLALAQADSAANAEASGIALNDAAIGQPVRYLTQGPITIGGTVAVGKVYAVSGTAGAIAPIEDLANPSYVTVLGIGTTTGVIEVNMQRSGVQIPA